MGQHQKLVMHETTVGPWGADPLDASFLDGRLVLLARAVAVDVVEDDLHLHPAAPGLSHGIEHLIPARLETDTCPISGAERTDGVWRVGQEVPRLLAGGVDGRLVVP